MGLLTNLAIVIGILVVLFIVYKMTRKSPYKYYKKAMKYHRLGEKSYGEGDAELSYDYYEEAEHYRKKAREMENVV